jgi:hypothetical protein
MARKRDAIDESCEEWARVQRELQAGAECITYLGRPRCTLSERRDLHHGSSSAGNVTQHFPEVHTDKGWAVSRAYQHMSLSLREILFVHYAVPAPVKVKIERLGIGPRMYWDRLARAKAYVDGWLASIADVA